MNIRMQTVPTMKLTFGNGRWSYL